MKPAYDGILFDLDGTLWDSSGACARGWNRALNDLGLANRTVTAKDVQSVMGLPHTEVFQKAFPEVPPSDRERVAQACFDGEMAAIREEGGGLFPGVAEGIRALAARYPLFVVSNCLEDYLDAFLGGSGLGALFKDWECYGRTGRPKGENIRAVVQRNGLERSCYVGDTAGDQSAAAHAGLDYFHVEYGFGQPQGEPLLRFREFAELTRFFLS